MQRLQVFVGTAHCSQANGLHLNDAPGFPSLFQRTTRQRLEGVERIDVQAQVTAIALANLDQAAEGQHAHGFAHGVAADAQLRGKLRFGGQALANGPGTGVDARAQLVQGLVDQGAFDQGGHGLTSNHRTNYDGAD